MTTLTTVFGLAPLVFFPGAGSELYRGIGSVVLGGLLLSTILTLFLIPTLLSLLIRWETGIALAFSNLSSSKNSVPRPAPEAGAKPETNDRPKEKEASGGNPAPAHPREVVA
jgi:HAE1 family hydrophobic/amphiphilic exporter-1